MAMPAATDSNGAAVRELDGAGSSGFSSSSDSSTTFASPVFSAPASPPVFSGGFASSPPPSPSALSGFPFSQSVGPASPFVAAPPSPLSATGSGGQYPPDFAFMSSQDREEIRVLAQRGRACAVLSSVGLGLLSFRVFKRQNARFPLLGAALVGLTLGPPVGFAGYMAFNYSQVQRMAEKFREAQLRVEASKLAQQMQAQSGAATAQGPLSSAVGGIPSWKAAQNPPQMPLQSLPLPPENESFAPSPGELLRT